MLKRISMLVLVLAAASLAADKPEDVLLMADRDFSKATAERRLDGWMSYFASQAVLFGLEPPVVGQEAIHKFYERIFGDPNFQLTWEPTRGEMFASGDTGYTTGRYEMRLKNAKGETVVRHGHYLTVWKKQADGSWKVVADGGAPDR